MGSKSHSCVKELSKWGETAVVEALGCKCRRTGEKASVAGAQERGRVGGDEVQKQQQGLIVLGLGGHQEDRQRR